VDPSILNHRRSVEGVIYTEEAPERRGVPQVVGRPADAAPDEEWGDLALRTQIVVIGTAGSINAKAMTEQFDSYLSTNGTGVTW